MFNQLADRFDTIFRNLRGLGKITDSNIQQTSREIRRILLEADVNFKVAKAFLARVRELQGDQSFCGSGERSCRRDKSPKIG